MVHRTSAKSPSSVADALHSAAIHLLRKIRKEDERTGITASRLSALSVLVFGGPMRVTDLATWPRGLRMRPTAAPSASKRHVAVSD
jgi:hypothetical protein